jgi:leucyl/phenylalanyl-tRNA--protein transferase
LEFFITMHYVSKELYFPPVSEADEEGILAIGGDLHPERLQLAYRSGIFPWFNEGEPILWWSPDPRMVLFLDELIVSKSMRNVLNRNHFKVTFNQNFRAVISNCQVIKRDGQNGTWISDEMINAYCQLNEQGIAKSVEVWRDEVLVGGLYGIDLGHVFCGESMFSKESNASKVAFIALVNQLKKENYKLLDCQVYNPHLESLGCCEIERELFMEIIKSSTF